MKNRIQTHKDLDVYRMAFESAMEIFEMTKRFPKEETYSLVDQIRRSSRSVCANTAEGFRKRLYPAAFVHKLSDADGEAAETQVWLDFSVACKYVREEQVEKLYTAHDHIEGKLVRMMQPPEQWKV
ncbi:MAG: four helix bundle protein [Bacteroidetes bacterium]|nr:four helix bundle protein [Bacteroidota bacterium]MCW5895395.1 four helix bundle protein [Bacteroidota bacterium]